MKTWLKTWVKTKATVAVDVALMYFVLDTLCGVRISWTLILVAAWVGDTAWGLHFRQEAKDSERIRRARALFGNGLGGRYRS